MFGIKKRKPFPLTDEQVMAEALKNVRSYARRHPDDSFDVNACVELVLMSIESVWRDAKGYSYHGRLSAADGGELTMLSERIRNELRIRAYNEAVKCLRNRKVQQINNVTAGAILTAELKKRGIPFFFDFQSKRVKVTLKMKKNQVLSFFVSHSDIQKGKLPYIIDEAVSIVETLDNSNLKVTVSDKWEKWKDWTI